MYLFDINIYFASFHFMIFDLVFKLFKISLPQRDNLYLSYVYAAVHALYAFIATVLYLGSVLTPEFYSSITAAYTIYDLINMFAFRDIWEKTPKNMVGHHVFLFLVICLFFDQHGYYIARGLLCEISTFFVNITWLLLHTSFDPNSIIERNRQTILRSLGVTSLVLYFIFRILNFGQLFLMSVIWQMWFFVPLSGYLFYINIVWFLKLLDKVKLPLNGPR